MQTREFLASLISIHSQDSLGNEYSEIAVLYEKKLWHQLSLKLETVVLNPYFASGNGLQELLNLYDSFLREFNGRINPLKYVKIMLVIASNLARNGEGVRADEFLQKILSGINKDHEREAYTLIQSEIALLKLNVLKQLDESKNLSDLVAQTLESSTGFDASIYSSHYRFLSCYYKVKVSATDFYKNTLLYLVYTPLDQIPIDDQRAIAFDLAVTALVSPDIHNFGELLAHPILNSLKETDQQWLVEFLFTFNGGDIDKFNIYLVKFQNQINSQAIIQSNLGLIRQKISILALMELVFNKPAHERTLSFSDIAKVTHLRVGEVEILVMKAMSLKLIKGVIDGVQNTVTISWVQPRILDLNQIAKMKDTLQSWTVRVKEVLSLMQNESGPELLV